MSAKVTLFQSRLKALDKAAIRALEKTAEAVHTDIVQTQVVPFASGHLQNDSTFCDYSDAASGHAEIVSSTPYARRLYYHPEYNFRRDENPSARGRWFEDWMPGGTRDRFAANAFAEFLKQEAGSGIS